MLIVRLSLSLSLSLSLCSIRELTNHAVEMFALKALQGEIVTDEDSYTIPQAGDFLAFSFCSTVLATFNHHFFGLRPLISSRSTYFCPLRQKTQLDSLHSRSGPGVIRLELNAVHQFLDCVVYCVLTRRLLPRLGLSRGSGVPARAHGQRLRRVLAAGAERQRVGRRRVRHGCLSLV